LLPSTGIFRLVNYFNNRRFAKIFKKAMAELGFSDIILFNDNDIYNGFYLKELLSPSLYIYYLRDFLQGFSYWKNMLGAGAGTDPEIRYRTRQLGVFCRIQLGNESPHVLYGPGL